MFYLFTFQDYEAGGGMNDYRGQYETVAEAIAQGDLLDNAQVVTVSKDGLRVVAEYPTCHPLTRKWSNTWHFIPGATAP